MLEARDLEDFVFEFDVCKAKDPQDSLCASLKTAMTSSSLQLLEVLERRSLLHISAGVYS